MIIHKEDKEKLNPKITDLRKGAVFLVNKPMEWTSFDVVNKLRKPLSKSYRQRRFKVGHAGTLDPLAEGLLIICVGSATKDISDYMHLPKGYEGTITFGATTPSYDKETEVDQTFDTSLLNLNIIKKAANKFVGNIEQKPPMYSAIKVKGTPLYKLARKGKTVERRPRSINVYEFNINSYKDKVSDFTVKCSKGTYVRSLAHDLGKELNNGAYLSSLKRNFIGKYHLDDAWEVEELADIFQEQYVKHY